MNWKSKPYLLLILMIVFANVTWSVYAEDAESKTSTAVTSILFEYDAEDFASYTIKDNGFLDITFARNTPNALYSEILHKLKSNPDIKGVLSGKSGPTCSRF